MRHTLFLLMLCGYSFGAVMALLGIRGAIGRALVALGAATGAIATLLLGGIFLTSSASFEFTLAEILPLTGVTLRLDGLGAFFLIVVGLIGIATAIYGFGYSKAYEDRYSLRLTGTMFNVLLLSLSLQVMADNALTFLVVWEIMSLSAYWLVSVEHDKPTTVRAASWYLAMTHAGFAALVAMFLLLAGGELTTSFTAMRSGSTALSPSLRNAIFILALLGFGSKAGIIPLHVWLPMAHPVAPSHVSAMMSGVVIKMGIYGLVRVTLDLLGGGPVWWGATVLALGAISALLGVLYALMEHDLKRLLAYHSVENIGIILIGVGAGMMFQSYGLMTLAALGFIGGLYHTINHAAFKGLLFLGAGSVLHATRTRNMEEMGGLIKRMPWTAAFFLTGAAAISALPPLNGFASEWIVFQSLLGGFNIPRPEVAMVMPLAVGMLALTSGLAVACFVKAFGITFLAIPRSHEAEHAHESPLSMRVGMGILALACVVLGLAPFVVVPQLSAILAGFDSLPDTQAAFTLGLTLQTPENFGQMSPTLAALGILILLGFTPLLLWLLRSNWKLRVSDSWGCGRIGQTPRMEYTATAFAEPLRRVFAELYRPSKELTIDFHPESKYFVQSIEYKSGITPWFEKVLYEPFLAFLRLLARQARRVQSGSVHLYLVYVMAMLMILLLAARLM
ncbi:MAG: hydrogenase 4 subunit B [candidate division KSB1 bacterium]|nr:hydrogenase 4 subunit B [candidate division KSB1 bacterium]MDZ7274320.1 hydrogenase 4 subunit B [candidate division KSB1 bacterium]MDZ7287158.1 hydrogenase 4 subunit B [candidate division KSB1 bacterium]MDZ7296917.1 hydrogenase 4 subunit B [candidate division KSB1 bacterium]MDZ7307870.1 hydrogenase 4 subunit B [candidate division KSB1 bacterium]